MKSSLLGKQKQIVNKQTQDQPHIPVLPNEVLELLDPQAGEGYLDLTAGYGGHAAAVLARTRAPRAAVLVDRDEEAAKYLRRRFGSGPRVIHSDYLAVSRQLASAKQRFDLVLADLGVSSPHLDRAERGFAISADTPLDMRMDQRQELSALNVLNDWSEDRLAQTLRQLGQEPKARQIARRVVAARPLKTTGQLAEIAASVWRGPRFNRSRVHPATRTFQAVRMVVNDELSQLEQSLPIWLELLAPGGRLAVISFHSLEDRLVKNFFNQHAGNRYDAQLRLLVKKPVMASPDELVSNPRARSARLRAAAKIKKKGL